MKIGLRKISLNNQFFGLSNSPFHKCLGTYPPDLRWPMMKVKNFSPWIKPQMPTLFPDITLKIAYNRSQGGTVKKQTDTKELPK